MKPGTEYELFVKQVYEMLLATELPWCTIQHDILLSGRGGIQHQIDLYWEFTIAGITYKTAVECKDYNTRVSKQKIAAFHAILEDIGGIHGIYATKIGYQSGAREFAKQYGIELLEIRHPNERDLVDRITEAHITLIAQNVTNINMNVSIDSRRLTGEEIIPEDFSVDVIGKSLLSFEKIDPVADVKTVQDLVTGLPRGHDKERARYSYSFSNGYLDYEGYHIPITDLQFDYKTIYSTHELVVKANPELLIFIKNVIKEDAVTRTIEGGEFHGILQE